MNEHTFKRFDEELNKLIMRVIAMGTLAQEQVVEAIRAIEQRDTDLAARVIARDDRIDSYDIKIEKLCMRLFALQQPVAMDLRIVMSALAINRNLERIGDYAVNIAEQTRPLSNLPPALGRTRIVEMARAAEQMVFDALQAFINNDVELARGVALNDNVVDAIDRETFELLTRLAGEDPSLAEVCMRLLLVARNVERLADEATNIAEEVIFVVDAKIVKHRNWDDLEDAHPFGEDTGN
jgi:phosphate transport system protein